MTERIGMHWTEAQLEEFRNRKQKLEVITDGMDDDALLHLYVRNCPSSWRNTRLDKNEKEKLSERWAQHRSGLTLAQKLRLQFLTKGEFKIEDFEYGY